MASPELSTIGKPDVTPLKFERETVVAAFAKLLARAIMSNDLCVSVLGVLTDMLTKNKMIKFYIDKNVTKNLKNGVL
ncbi:MAG: hypothetical protein ACON38_07055 [Akkermansiaceae bacterium]